MMKTLWRRMNRMLSSMLGMAGVLLVTCAFAPQALAFPYRQVIGDTKVYSETPISLALPGVLARSDALLRRSAIYRSEYGRSIFLTDGGWRWRLLAMRSSGSFAFTRPLTEAIVINRSDAGHDRVYNGAPIAGERSLSGVIAHERTHGLIRAHFGIVADFLYPAWLREGYCDEVAGGGSLSERDAALLKAQHVTVPAMLYFDGRKRVEAILRSNGGSVDALFDGKLAQR